MTQQLIAVDAGALEALHDEVTRLHRRLDELSVQPRPEWLTVRDYAATAKVSERTVIRRIEAGEVETKRMAGKRMVRV